MVSDYNDSLKVAFNSPVESMGFSQIVNVLTHRFYDTLNLHIEPDYLLLSPINPFFFNHYFITFEINIVSVIRHNKRHY